MKNPETMTLLLDCASRRRDEKRGVTQFHEGMSQTYKREFKAAARGRKTDKRDAETGKGDA
jgi:hypothetical protein